MDAAATATLAELYRREQATGRCLDAEQLAALAVSHLYAMGYRRTAEQQPTDPVRANSKGQQSPGRGARGVAAAGYFLG